MNCVLQSTVADYYNLVNVLGNLSFLYLLLYMFVCVEILQ